MKTMRRRVAPVALLATALTLSAFAEEGSGRPAALFGNETDLAALEADVLQPGRYAFERLGVAPAAGTDLGKYAVLYFGAGAEVPAEDVLAKYRAAGATVIVAKPSLGEMKAGYAKAGKRLGYADDIGDWVFTDEGKAVKDLTERYALAFQTAPGLLRSGVGENWALKPLGTPGTLKPPTQFTRRATYLPPPVRKDGLCVVGGERDAVIVVRPEDAKAFSSLADELQWHLQEMSGRKLAIVGAEPSDGTPAIAFRRFDGKNDRAVIRREGNVVLIGGIDAGPSHALTYLLESLGIRYLWSGPTGKVIPKREKVTLPELSLDWETPFRVRRMRLYGKICVLDREGNRDFFRWHGMNDIEGFSDFKPLKSDRWEWGHYYGDFYPRFKDVHPEWFALQPDGTRVLHIGIHTERPTFCLSNDRLAEYTAECKLAEYAAAPWKKALTLCLPDGATSSPCMCEACRRLDPVNAAPGSVITFWPKREKHDYVALTDRTFDFMNRIAAIVSAKHPELLLSCYAYGSYTAPPVKTVPHRNLLILSVAGNYSSTKDYYQAERNLAAWMSFGNPVIWRPNMSAGFRARMPQNYARLAFTQISDMAENGVYGTDFDTMHQEWAAKGIGYFFTAKAHLNPDRLDYDTLLDDFCRAGFGAAAAPMKEYFDTLERSSNEAAARNAAETRPEIGWEGRQRRWHRLAETTDFDRLDALVASARRLAQGDDAVLRRLVRFEYANWLGRWTANNWTRKPTDEEMAELRRRTEEALAVDPAVYDLISLGLAKKK